MSGSLAAVQLVSVKAAFQRQVAAAFGVDVAAAFGVDEDTLILWRKRYERPGVEGLVSAVPVRSAPPC